MHRWILGASLTLASACTHVEVDPFWPHADPRRPRNVLLIVLDDVGIDKVPSYLDAYGIEPAVAPITPGLDALADRGVRFDRAFANPVCTPSRASLLTGRYAGRSGLGETILAGGGIGLSADAPSLPRTFYDQGYSTVIVGKWHLGRFTDDGGETLPAAFGFERFAVVEGNLGDFHAFDVNEDGVEGPVQAYATTRQVDDAVRLVRDLAEPWLAVVSFSATHDPWHCPPAELLPWRRRCGDDKAERQAAMLQAVDTEVLRLIDELGRFTAGPVTTVVVGDNGTDRAAVVEPFLPDRAKESLFEGGARVPLLVHGHGRGVVHELAHVSDLYPTLAELVGIEVDDGPNLDGRSWATALADPDDAVALRDAVLVERFLPNGPVGKERRVTRYALRTETHRLMVLPEGTSLRQVHGPGQLFDGPDLIAVQPALAAELRARLDEHLEAIDSERPVPTAWR